MRGGFRLFQRAPRKANKPQRRLLVPAALLRDNILSRINPTPGSQGQSLMRGYRTPHNRSVLALAAVLLLALTRAAPADEVENFYRGRTLTMVIAYTVGGGYDLYARVLARTLGKYIPGHPSVLPENLPGAGGLRASNYLYEVAPKDGSVMGTFSRSIPTMPLVTPTAVKFDGRRFSWIGSMSSDTSLCLTGAKSAVKTFNDMLTMPVVMGGQFAAADSDIYARLYKNVLGAKIKLVSGYPGTNDIVLAMERGEVDGICGLSWGTIKVAHASWLKDKSVHFLVQAALKKDPELSDVPLALDLIDDPEKKQILYVNFAPQAIGRPFAAPPGIPADRKAALIKAFDAAMKDPDLLAEAAKENMDISPTNGHDIDDLLGKLYAIAPDVLAKAAKAVAE
jgi:tripartite-type tricarboxylate transporter receptor subunit TctC